MNELKLRAKIVEKGYTIPSMAKEIGISEAAMYNKLAGRSNFDYIEITRISKACGMTKDELISIFFDGEVSEKTQEEP